MNRPQLLDVTNQADQVKLNPELALTLVCRAWRLGRTMLENQQIRPASVLGPLGEALSLETLPAAGATRWVIRRKAEVVAAVNGGLLTIDEACERYDLTLDELTSWQRAIERSGMYGLRTTRIQHYRELYERQNRY